MAIKIVVLPTTDVLAFQSGQADANGLQPEQTMSEGNGNPCRHCLKEITAGEPMLVLAHRPFSNIQPYAEVGPIFLCAKHCEAYPQNADIPKLYENRTMLVRGYTDNQRICYGTGKIIPMTALMDYALSLFSNKEIAFVHVRSATNNCYHFKVERQ